MQQPHPMGMRTRHVMASDGPATDILNVYHSRYSSDYGAHYGDDYKPRTTKHTGTGYLANFRPQVFYSRRLDQLDNPAMGVRCADNYSTITQRHFQPVDRPDGKEPLPSSVKYGESGYVKDVKSHNALQRDVRVQFADSRSASYPIAQLPKAVPLLHKIQSKDAVENENYNYGPKFMSTEYATRYEGQQADRRDPNSFDVGYLEPSGHVSNKNVEPISYQPNQQHANDLPGHFTNRPTGVPLYRTAYQQYHHVDAPLPNVAFRSERGTGNTRENMNTKPGFFNKDLTTVFDKVGQLTGDRYQKVQQQDPAELANLHHPDNKSSVYKIHYSGKQWQLPEDASKLGRVRPGWLETGGAVNNTTGNLAPGADDANRWNSTYRSRFSAPAGRLPEMGAQNPRDDGFTRSERRHQAPPPVEARRIVQSIDPYIGRSLQSRDPYFHDTTYAAKNRGPEQGRPLACH